MPDDARFWDRAAARYAKRPIGNMTAYNQTLDHVRGSLAPDDEVLEIGCGTGTTALALAGSVARLTATDYSAQMLAIARDKTSDQGIGNVEFVQSSANALPFSDDQFDVAMAFNFLHLLKNLSSTLRGVHRVLKPGGLFLSKTPCLGEMTFLLRLLIPPMKLIGKAPFVTFPKKQMIEAAIREAGFEIVEARSFDTAKNSWFVAARKL